MNQSKAPKNFDPNAMATADSGIFGLVDQPEDSSLVIIPVPWEATTSYGDGTSLGPSAILQASHQVDLYDLNLGSFYEKGIAMLPIPQEIIELNTKAKALCKNRLLSLQTQQNSLAESDDRDIHLNQIQEYSRQVNSWVYETSKHWLERGKKVAVLGGDHSSPLGLIQALSEEMKSNFGILHIDAHADLRIAYQNYEYSHASIMWNAINLPQAPKKLVQVGIRDFCQEEYEIIQSRAEQITTFFDAQIQKEWLMGRSWFSICENIVERLPQNVYVSFDIDGLSPDLCPSTGTPVPGGLSFHQAMVLLDILLQKKKNIIGFDLCEVSPSQKPSENDTDDIDEWDANVGARILFQLCGRLLHSAQL